MKLYEKNEISISIIEDEDKEEILKLFSENNFNCDYETGAIKPTREQFLRIIDGIISGKDDENNIIVIKKQGKVVGYQSMFVDYDMLNIGHVAIKEEERGKGYGKLLAKLAILIAENEERNIVLFCNYPNRYFKELGFETRDNLHYLYKRKGIKVKNLPRLFVSKEKYRERAEKRSRVEIENYKNFIKKNINMLDRIEEEIYR